MYESFTSLVRFIPMFFILFDVIINGIVFLISFTDCSLSMYRNATNFCMSILYPATWPNLFIIHSILSSVNKDNITSTFSIECLLFIYFCLLALPRNSNTVLNRNGKSKHPCLVPHCRRKARSFSPWSVM